MGRPQPETATLAAAVALAVALGVACGVWINTRLTTAAASKVADAKTALAPARLMPAPAGPKAPAPSGDARAASDDSLQQTVGDDSRQHGVSDDSHPAASDEGAGASPDAPDATSESQAQGPPPTTYAGRKEGPAASAVASAAREANPSGKAHAARDNAREIDAEPRARVKAGGAAPCTPYASAGSLTLRAGGAAALVVGGPGEAGRVTVTTPDWADIAVFAEGRAGGNGWVRYSVRSVGGRPGRYTLHFTTPCGSQDIPVTVTRP